MFAVNEDQYLEYAGDIDIDSCEFVSFLNCLLENKTSLKEVLLPPISTPHLALVVEDHSSFLMLSIKHRPSNTIHAGLLIDSSLINSRVLFQSLKQLFLKSAQNCLTYKITASQSQNANETLLLGTKEIFVIKKQQFPSYTSKLVDVVTKYKRSAKILINKITFGNLWRARAKSEIIVEGDVRLDLQGVDQEKFNYQLQTGKDTISAVLIDIPISKISITSEQSYAVRKIKSGFQQSLDDLHIYKVSFNKS